MLQGWVRPTMGWNLSCEVKPDDGDSIMYEKENEKKKKVYYLLS